MKATFIGCRAFGSRAAREGFTIGKTYEIHPDGEGLCTTHDDEGGARRRPLDDFEPQARRACGTLPPAEV